MRIVLASFALAALVGCGGAEKSSNADDSTPSGWRYLPAHGAYHAEVSYVDQARVTKFAGFCQGTPNYFLKGGDYPTGATRFTLIVDDRSWELPISQGEHGRLLPVERQEQQVAIAKAKRRIVFQVGNWRVELHPGPELASFVSDCS